MKKTSKVVSMPRPLVKTSERHFLRVSDILIDETTQRKLNTAWAQKIAHEFDPDRLRTIAVSRRDAGDYVVDGQHRLAALKLMDYGDQKVECEVFDRRGMTEAEARREDARLFLELNNTLAHRTIRKFQLEVTAGDPEAVAINKMVQDCGLRVAEGAQAGSVSAVVALRLVYSGAKTGKATPEALRKTLETILQAWGKESSNFSARILAGIGMVFIRYGDAVDQATLVKRLACHQGGAGGLMGSAAAYYGIRKGDYAKCLASVVVDIYNRGRQRSKLESFLS